MRLLAGPARNADALFLLGDIFDAWLGDDQIDHDPHARRVSAEIAQFCAAGIPTYLLSGNRDFMLREQFANTCGAVLLPAQVTLHLNNQRVLLLHGDELCTDDVAYQHLRATMTRNLSWCAQMRAQPFPARMAMAAKLQEGSRTGKVEKSDAIMDVNEAAVQALFRATGVSFMIHGHTHRPATHTHDVDGRTCTRHVLDDWQGGSGYTHWNGSALQHRPWP